MNMFVKTLLKIVGTVVILFLMLAYMPGLLDINPSSISLRVSPAFEGPLAANTKLDGIEKLFEGILEGPEAFAFHNGDIYTGLADGRLIRIRGDQIVTIAHIGNPNCEGRWEEDKCGRPLGLRFDATGQLLVADAYYGLFKVNINTGEITTLHPNTVAVNGRELKVTNNMDISKSGDVYFTDSTRWPLTVGFMALLDSSQDGRLLQYNPKTNTTTELVSGLTFANGVQLSPNEEFVLIAETGKMRVMKYHLKGKNQGKLEVFADNLPGVPDNIRMNPRGGYWIGLCSSRIPGGDTVTELLSDKPIFRKVLARLIHLLQVTINFMNLGNWVTLKELQYKLGHMSPIAHFGAPKYGLVVELNQKGEIIRSLHSPKGVIRFISEAAEHDGYLYLGSPWHPFIGRLKLA